MDWEDRLDDWEVELELNAQLVGSDWATLERAAADTGVSRAALRSWYRTGQIPSRLVDGPHGPQRLVPVAVVAARAEASPRLRRAGERRLAEQAQLEILRHRVDQLELRLAGLERRRAEQDLANLRVVGVDGRLAGIARTGPVVGAEVGVGQPDRDWPGPGDLRAAAGESGHRRLVAFLGMRGENGASLPVVRMSALGQIRPANSCRDR
jgi:transposase